MEHAKSAIRPIAAAFALALVCASHSAFAVPQNICFTSADLQSVQEIFFAHFPDADAFKKYADKSKFELLTNVQAGVDLEKNHKPAGEKVDWLVRTMIDHKELFSNFAFEKPDFTYMKGQLRGGTPSVDNLTTSKKFPKNECVQQVNYQLPRGACAMSQRLQGFSLSFVKDERPLSLRGVEMFFYTCPGK